MYRTLSILVILAVVMPPGVGFAIGGLVLNPMRMLAIFMLFFMLKEYSEIPRLRSKMDIFVYLHLLFVVAAIGVNHGFGRAIESGGVYVLELLPFYLFGKGLLAKPERLIYFLKVIFASVLILIPFAVFETLTSFNIYYDLFNVPYYIVDAPRFGLDRASVTLPHPILFGLYISMFSGFFLIVFGGKVKRYLLYFAGVFTSLSSAPFLSLMAQWSLLIWRKFFQSYEQSFKRLLIFMAVGYVLLDIVIKRPVLHLVIEIIAFNPQTAWYRLAIWEYGSENVEANPWFGIGFSDWVRPGWMVSDSVDNFWLLTAMRYGLPALIFLLLPILLTLYRIMNSKVLYYQKAGWIVSMIGILIVGATVHFWMGVFSLFIIMIGIGVGLKEFKVYPIGIQER